MSETNDRKSPEQRLRFLRFGLLAVTGVAFAMGATLDYLVSSAAFGTGDLIGAAVQGVIYGAVAGVISVMIYFVYRAFVVKPE